MDAEHQALVALIDAEVVWDHNHRQALADGHGEEFVDRTYDEWADRHDRSVQSFVSVSGQSRPDAELAVASLLNHATRLADAFPWFGQRSALWRAALNETVSFAAGDCEVSHRSAQEACSRCGSACGDRAASSSSEDPCAGLREPWQHVWASWADGTSS